MCGIYGIVGDVGESRLILARALCVLNESRGNHSAGIAILDRSRESHVFRRAESPLQFAKRDEFAKLAGGEYRALIGHTRWATHGSICDRNAHPFRSGGTVGVHNGVVSNVAGMEQYTGKKFPVDSQYLIHCLDRFGTIGPAAGSINLLYFSRQDTADLRVIRDGNPLAAALVNRGRGLVLSSEENHLRSALAIAGLAARYGSLEDDSALAVSVDVATGKIHDVVSEVPRLPEDQASPYQSAATLDDREWWDFEQPAKSHSRSQADFDYVASHHWRDGELRNGKARKN